MRAAIQVCQKCDRSVMEADECVEDNDRCPFHSGDKTLLTMAPLCPGIDLTREQIEAYRVENRISMEPPLPQWAVEENRIMDALCDFALHSLTDI